MSNETIKLEADCAVATYNHHHHHHHHQNPHLQLHHNQIAHHQVHHVLTSSHGAVTPPTPAIKASADIRDAPCERLAGGLVEDDEEQENKNYNGDFRSASSSELTASIRTPMHTAPTIDDIKLSGAPPQNDQVDHHYQSFNHSFVITSGDKYTQLESVNPQQIIQRDAIQTNLYPPAATKISSTSDTSESSEDDIDSEGDDDEQVVGENEADDDEYGDEDNDEDEEDEEEEEDDDEEDDDDEDEDDEDDETSQDQDCDDIVDPVGHHHHFMHHQNGCNGQTIMNGIYQSAISNNNESTSDDEEEDEDDISFENEADETVAQDSVPSDLSLNSERMLEVTRKLVRSTERDPDRDLRKQVLLRTAIRRLPHFMESSCNHYPDTFDQNFRLHNNTMNENNSTTLECLSPSQYYENHNIYHLESTQPKSYYHSVQPNAIQMSTTSLRMLDLNDDQDSEIIVQPVSDSMDSAPPSATTTTTKHPNSHLISYESIEHENHHVTHTTTTSLEQQHEYSNSNIYSTYSHPHHIHRRQQQNEDQMNQIQDLNNLVQSDQRTVMHDFNQFSNVDHHIPGSSGNIIARHSTLDNLYQPLSTDSNSGDITNELKTDTTEPAAFQDIHDYSRVVVSPEHHHHHCYEHADGVSTNPDEERLTSSVMDSMDQSLTIEETATTTIPDSNNKPPIDASDVLDSDETATSRCNDNDDDLNNNNDQDQKENDCHLHHHHTTNTTVYNDTTGSMKLVEDSNADECTPVSPPNEFLDETTIANRLNDEDQTSICLDGGSSSSQSSTSSDDSVNSSTQSNDSAGDSTGTSILETSLNTSSEYHYRSHDSGVALFSPKSNKRSSSSIGLDDEMEIDHLSSDHSHHMTNSNQIFTGSVANHCKRLRKKEIID